MISRSGSRTSSSASHSHAVPELIGLDALDRPRPSRAPDSGASAARRAGPSARSFRSASWADLRSTAFCIRAIKQVERVGVAASREYCATASAARCPAGASPRLPARKPSASPAERACAFPSTSRGRRSTLPAALRCRLRSARSRCRKTAISLLLQRRLRERQPLLEDELHAATCV